MMHYNKTNVFLFGHGGSLNHGCEAILRTTTIILNSVMTEPIITFASNNPDEDKSLNLPRIENYIQQRMSFSKWHPRRIAVAIFNRLIRAPYIGANIAFSHVVASARYAEIAISIGGDNYCYGSPYWLFSIDRNLKKAGKKLLLWGCSIEPSLLNSDIITDLNSFDLIIPRESITYNALLEKGINKNTHLFPDPAFILDKINLPLPKGFVENNTVGLNVSPLIMRLEKYDNITYKNCANLIKHIIETSNMQVALIPHVTWEHNNDLEPLTALYEQFKDTGRVVIIGDQYNCMELKGFISRCRMFVGARTHATIAAYSTCVPTLVVGYSVKARGIARDIFGSEEDMVIPVQSLNHEDDLVNAFKYIQENEDAIKKHLQNFMPSYVEKAWLAGGEVKKLIEK